MIYIDDATVYELFSRGVKERKTRLIVVAYKLNAARNNWCSKSKCGNCPLRFAKHGCGESTGIKIDTLTTVPATMTLVKNGNTLHGIKLALNLFYDSELQLAA